VIVKVRFAQPVWRLWRQGLPGDRRIAADERLADEVGDLRDRGEDGNVVYQQIGERVPLPLDHLPFRLRRQQDRLDPIDKLHQVICPHVVPQAAERPRST